MFDVSAGWPPLCEFLDVDQPEDPFPRVNDTLAFRAYNRDLLEPVQGGTTT